MQVQSVNNAAGFQGKFKPSPLFNKFKDELTTKQKEVFEKQLKTIEQTNDGRVFKFDKFVNPYEAGGAEVGIFEQKALINDTYWIPLFCAKRENAISCFDRLNELYINV